MPDRSPATKAPAGSAYTIRSLDASTWDAFAELVERNNGIYGGCWCIAFHACYRSGESDPRSLKEHLVLAGRAPAALVAQATPEEMATQWDHVRDTLGGRFDRAARLMDNAKAEVLGFNAFPRAHWRQIWSTNPLERLNREIKRRCRVVGIFPTEGALIRLAASVLIDTHEEWIATERRYFSEGSMAKLYSERDDEQTTAELESAR